jgi:hypothetical protein
MKTIAKCALLSFALGMCFQITELAAWERKPVDYDRCRSDGISPQRCEKQTEDDNMHDFEVLLRTNSLKVFNDFLPAQKKQAMDYADHNQMSPDDAVAKVRARR